MCLKEIFCKEEMKINEEYKIRLINLQNELDILRKENELLKQGLELDKQGLMQMIELRDNMIADLQKQIEDLKKLIYTEDIEVRMVREKYYEKYPDAKIEYTGRYFGDKINNVYSLDLKVFAQAGMNNFRLIDFVASQNAFVKDIQKEHPDWSFHRCCDEAVLRISRATPVRYAFDNTSFDTGEYWAFSFETFIRVYQKGEGADCEDYSHLRYILYRIAGVPAEFLRIVCGYTRGGYGGHSTIHYLPSQEINGGKWVHINSTSTITSFADWKDKNDPNDGIGIDDKDVWFSFNEDKCWSSIPTETGTRAKRFKNSNKYKVIKITK